MSQSTFALLLAGVLSISAIRTDAQIIIIASPALKVQSISKDDLRSVFTGVSQNLHRGPHVSPVLLTWSSSTHSRFLETHIGEKAGDFRAEWMSLLFAGKLRLPPTLATEVEVVDYVLEHPSTIGYIDQATPHPGVIVLIVK